MEGPGADLLHTDTTDAGGWFRNSVRLLCTDLQVSARRKADGTIPAISRCFEFLERSEYLQSFERSINQRHVYTKLAESFLRG